LLVDQYAERRRGGARKRRQLETEQEVDHLAGQLTSEAHDGQAATHRSFWGVVCHAYTRAGRSLTKHGVGKRPDNSKFPAPKGNPQKINDQAQALVDEILSDPGTTITDGFRPRFGDTIEAVAPDGRGLVFDASGKFLFFKE